MDDPKPLGRVDRSKFPEEFWAKPVRYKDVEGILDAVSEPIRERIQRLEARIAELEARPVVKYLGVHDPGRQYAEGNLVTHGGSIWHANCTTSRPPGDGSDDWILAAKRGRDGKDATR